MKTKFLCILSIIFFLATLLPAQAARSVKRKRQDDSGQARYALVIGNAKYRASPLRNSVNDATDIASALRSSGFKVTLLKNGSHRQMKKAIKKFGRNLSNGGVGLFYFAGHGLQVDGHNYLVPIGADLDTESEVEYEAIDAGRVLGQMEDAGNDVNIVILDACRNNPYARSFRSARKGLAQMDAPTGSIVAYSTAPGSVAADGHGRNGVYTKHLLKYMRQENLTIGQLLMQVRKGVLRETGKKQIPWESSSLTGNFYFRGGGVQVVASSPIHQGSGTDRDALFWQSINASTDPAMFQAYLDQFPNGTFASLASLKLSQLQQVREQSSLTVRSQPQSARIRILNINPAYKAGMKLAPARYHLEVSARGYETKTQWFELPASEDYELAVRLKQIKAKGPKKGDTYTDPTTGIQFVYIPKGCYQMGSSNGGSDEKPVHEVCVDGFYMGKYEVTQGQYQAIMGKNPSKFKSGNNYPVEQVSWHDAQSFIKKLKQQTGKTYRLPTEAEWEYAARGGTTTMYYWGNQPSCHKALYGNDPGSEDDKCISIVRRKGLTLGSTVSVGRYPANPFGLYDMTGNVWEWCSDWYDSSYYGSSPRQNPQGPSSGSYRVVRGGCWSTAASLVSMANRFRDKPDIADYYMGFRLIFSSGQ